MAVHKAMAFTMRIMLVVAVMFPAAGLQPRSPDVLSRAELSNITSVECLEARLKNPDADCDSLETRKIQVKYSVNSTVGDSSPEQQVLPEVQVSFYNYPNFRDKICQSDGAHFCDPYGSLSASERQNLSTELTVLAKTHLITCPDLFREPINERHLQPFYLGVALAKTDRALDLERSALKQYGHLIMTEWNMDRLYAADTQTTRCPNQALLVVLIDHNKAVLATESSIFIAEDSSKAAAIENAAEAALTKGEGVSAAVLAAVRTGYTSLENTVVEGQDIPPLFTKVTEASNDSTWLLFMQRALFAFACGALGLSLSVGLLVMCLAPGLAKGRRDFK